MNILVINAGSSSVKFTLFGIEDDTVMATGIVERIGLKGTQLYYRNFRGDEIKRNAEVADTSQAIAAMTSLLMDEKLGVIRSKEEISAIGHRVVHGGEKIRTSALITTAVKKIIVECFELAPLHNPPNMEGIETCEANFHGIPQAAVFDTAFHTTLPDYAYLYGLPYQFYRKIKSASTVSMGPAIYMFVRQPPSRSNCRLTSSKSSPAILVTGAALRPLIRG